ncbi:MAG: VOC family protein [Dehalococcoidia bacterium]|nr:VOC family protein [Dehalococcoidia bacterium]
MGIEGIMKIGIATKEMDRTAMMIGDALGLVPGEAVAYPPLGMRYRILRLGDFLIEVMEPIGSDGPIARFIERNGEGLQHMTFKVTGIEQVMADMKSKGLRFTSSAPVTLDTAIGTMKFVFVNPRGSNGVLIQLAELF